MAKYSNELPQLDRIAELEEENRLLREGASIS